MEHFGLGLGYWNSEASKSLLGSLGVTCPEANASLVATYMGSLVGRGMIPPPGTAGAAAAAAAGQRDEDVTAESDEPRAAPSSSASEAESEAAVAPGAPGGAAPAAARSASVVGTRSRSLRSAGSSAADDTLSASAFATPHVLDGPLATTSPRSSTSTTTSTSKTAATAIASAAATTPRMAASLGRPRVRAAPPATSALQRWSRATSLVNNAAYFMSTRQQRAAAGLQGNGAPGPAPVLGRAISAPVHSLVVARTFGSLSDEGTTAASADWKAPPASAGRAAWNSALLSHLQAALAADPGADVTAAVAAYTAKFGQD